MTSRVTYDLTNGSYSFVLPTALSPEDRDKFNRMFENFLTDAQSKVSGEEKCLFQTCYRPYPEGTTLLEADIVKCAVYDYITNNDKTSATVRYGGSVHRRLPRVVTETDGGYDEELMEYPDDYNFSSESKSVASVGAVRSRGAASKTSRGSVLRGTGVQTNFGKEEPCDRNVKKKLRYTAEQRYTNWPVIFDMTFEEKFRTETSEKPVYEKNDGVLVLDANGDPNIVGYRTVETQVRVTRQEQVVEKIYEMFLDKVHGGVSSRRRMKAEEELTEVKETNDAEDEVVEVTDKLAKTTVEKHHGKRHNRPHLRPGAHFVKSHQETTRKNKKTPSNFTVVPTSVVKMVAK